MKPDILLINQITKREIKKRLRFCGGFKGFYKLWQSFVTHVSVDVDLDDSSDYFADFTIKKRKIAIINKVIPSSHPSVLDYVDLCIDGERYTLMILDDDLDRLLRGVLTIGDSYEKILEKCQGQPCYLSVKYGFVVNLRLIDYGEYSDAIDLMMFNLTEENGKIKIINSKRRNNINTVPSIELDNLDFDDMDEFNEDIKPDSSVNDVNLEKFAYFGGYENLIGLHQSYQKFISEKLYMFNVDKTLCYRLTDVTIDGTSLAVIITATMIDEVCYIDAIIKGERYSLKLSNEELENLLTGLIVPTGDTDEVLKLIFGQPYFMSVENGFAKNLKIIDYDKYKAALELIPERIKK